MRGALTQTQLASAVLLTATPSHAAELDASPAYRLTIEPGAPAVARSAEAYQTDTAYRLRSAEVAAPPPPVDNRPFAQEIDRAARDAGVEPALVHAVVQVESAYRPDAVSPNGAVGLMQLLPGTAQRYGVTNLTQVDQNLLAGTRHLRALLDTFGTRLDLVLAAYNAGEGAVRRHKNAVPPYPETRNYVPAVMSRYKRSEEPEPLHLHITPTQVEYLQGTRLSQDALSKLQ